MKKQLGLLTLGMIVFLGVPIVSQASSAGVNEFTNATVNVTSSKVQETRIHSAPSFKFNLVSSSDLVNVNADEGERKLVVRNTNQANNNWSVKLYSKPLTNTDGDVLNATITLPEGTTDANITSGTGHNLVGSGWNSHDDQGKIVMQQTTKKIVGEFTHEFNTPTIATNVATDTQSIGAYVGQLTWVLDIDNP